MDIVLYARYSSHNQSECSIEGQLEVCKEYARLNNYNIVGQYIDRAKSGTKDDREEFLKMIEDSKHKNFKGILVYQLDRFARNRYDSAIYKKQLKDRDIKVLSAKENINDDPSGILMESVLEGMAEYYSAELGVKVKRGMNLNAECGYYNGGCVPLGFKLQDVIDERFCNNIKQKIKKKYVIDEEKAPIVKKIFEMYANDNKMADIIRYLNDLKLTTSYDKPFNKSSIKRILQNKKYVGVYTYHGEELEGVLPRIIDDDLFNKVQQELIKNGLYPSRRRAKTEYLLTGKLYCGNCKEKMTGVSGTSKTKQLHTYYACKNARNKDNNCKAKHVKKTDIEDLVVKFASDLLTDEIINEIAKGVVNKSNEQDTAELKVIQKNITDIEKRKTNLLKSISQCENDDVRKELFNEISKLTEKMKEYEEALTQEENKIIMLTVSEVKYFLKQLKKGNINDLKYKKLLINTFINKVYLYTNKVIIVYNVNKKEQEIEISLINKVESSPVESVALPYESKAT